MRRRRRVGRSFQLINNYRDNYYHDDDDNRCDDSRVSGRWPTDERCTVIQSLDEAFRDARDALRDSGFNPGQWMQSGTRGMPYGTVDAIRDASLFRFTAIQASGRE